MEKSNNVAHSRFVAYSQQAMIACHGRGHPGKVWAEAAETSKATRLDAGSIGGETWPRSELPR